jgi:uncharacterized membrane protein YidH (DUF202 family)
VHDYPRGRRLDAPSIARDNPSVGAAELVVLLVIGGACYAVLAPLRRAIVRRLLRRRGHRPGQVIPLVRNSDGVYTPPGRKTDGDKR